MTDFERIEYDQMVTNVRSLLNETEADLFWAEGRSMTTDDAIKLALE